MKLAIVSDLHLEGFIPEKRHEIMETIFDDDYTDYVAVFAGDILTRYEAPEFLDQYRSWFRDIIFIPGNHDFWFSDLDKMGSHPLDLSGGAVQYDGVTIIAEVGFPHHPARSNPFDQINWYNGLFECDHIRDHEEKFTFERWQEMARRQFNAIETTLSVVDRPTVVITHYPPTDACNNPHFADSDMTPLFVSGHEAWLMDYSKAPDVWISGHTHWQWDMMFGQTRLIGNCLGYNGELVSVYNYKPKIVEIG